MNVFIPELHRKVLRRWFELDSPASQRVEAALAEAMPTMTATGLGKQIARKLDEEQAEVGPLAQALVSMTATFATALEQSRAAFPSAVVNAVFEGAAAPADATARIERVLAIPALQVTAKVRLLVEEQQHVLQECRILTDLRPVFGDDDTEIRAATVTHQVRMSVTSPSGEEDHFFLSADGADLRELRATIERALSKQASLEAFAERAGITVVSEETA